MQLPYLEELLIDWRITDHVALQIMEVAKLQENTNLIHKKDVHASRRTAADQTSTLWPMLLRHGHRTKPVRPLGHPFQSSPSLSLTTPCSVTHNINRHTHSLSLAGHTASHHFTIHTHISRSHRHDTRNLSHKPSGPNRHALATRLSPPLPPLPPSQNNTNEIPK